ncbi:MAG: phosphoglucomutase/phosphomannomutase family protein, partial [candidate division NC10 bacterium]|nr:phosphoglucomutase/phosphomannomutase family protein [candidate division NC10 bacterium]
QNEVAREEIAQLLASSLSVRPDGFELEMVQDLDGTKLLFQDGSWLLLRPSGTEPVLRIYAEAPSDEGVSRLLDWGKTLASGLVVL